MKSQITNGYFISGNDYVAIVISQVNAAEFYTFTHDDSPAYEQAVAFVNRPAEKRSYIVEANIPRTSRGGILWLDPEVRDQRLLALSEYLCSQFVDEPTHILKAAGAIAVKMTEAQARKLTGHSMVKAVGLNRRLG